MDNKLEVQGEHQTLLQKIRAKQARIGIIGLGYVGLPLALTFCEAGFNVTGYDIDSNKIRMLDSGKSYLTTVDSSRIAACTLRARSSFSSLDDVDVSIITVPTPLNEYRQPDLGYVRLAVKQISMHMSLQGVERLVILESTSYPGTTREEVCDSIQKTTRAEVGKDYFVAFSPERENPGGDMPIKQIPKLISGITPKCLEAIKALYEQVFDQVVPVDSVEIAETAKVLENTYRAVNIALINEMRYLCEQMGIDVWKVVEAAATKPFGFQKFTPGFVGGHCISTDPTYLTYRVKKFECKSRLISEAEAINWGQPKYVATKICEILSRHTLLDSCNVLMLGVTYKPDVNDIRESGVLRLMDFLQEKGLLVDYNDSYVPTLKRSKGLFREQHSFMLTPYSRLADFEAVIIAVNHSHYDYSSIVQNAKRVIDIVNATKGMNADNIYRI